MSDARRLKRLEVENGKLKRLLADTMLDNVVLKDLAGKAMATPAQRREAALQAMRDHNISQRRACNLVGVDPKTVRRERPPDHVEIRRKMHEIAGNRRRFGYPLAGNGLPANRERRRVGILLEREGFIMNPKK